MMNSRTAFIIQMKSLHGNEHELSLKLPLFIIFVGLSEKREVSAPRCRGEEAGVTASDLE